MLFASYLLAVLASAGNALAQSSAASGVLTVNTPTQLIQCQPVQITYSGGVPPYIISALPGGQISAAPLETISSSATGTSVTWNVDLPVGTSITIQIRDSTGALNYATARTVIAGTSGSCVNATASSIIQASGFTSSPGTVALSTSLGTTTAAITTGGSTVSTAVTTPSVSATTSRPAGASSTSGAAVALRETVSGAATFLAGVFAIFGLVL